MALLLLVAAWLAVSLMFIALGQYAYPSADDFCMATGVREIGLWQHLWNHYFDWSGRYAGNAFYALYPLLFGLFDGYALIAGLLIGCLYAALLFALSGLFRLRWHSPPVLVVALGILAMYLLGLRHSASSLYWMAGGLSYQTSGILLLLAIGLILRINDLAKARRQAARHIAVLVVVIVLGMGTNEINLLVMSALMGTMLWMALVSGRRRSLWAGLLLLTLLCFAVVYLAPGNGVRESTFPLRHDWLRSIEGSLRMGGWSILAWVGVPAFIVGSLLIPFATLWLARTGSRRLRVTTRGLLLSVSVTLLMPLLLQFPAWWSMGGWPPPRSVDAIYFVFLLCWIVAVAAFTLRLLPAPAIWSAAGRLRPGAARLLLALAILFAVSLLINGRLIRAWNDLTIHAGPFHGYLMERHDHIESALARGQQSVWLPAYPGELPRSIYFNDIRPDWRDWRNTCYAQYFGLQAVWRVQPPTDNPSRRHAND